MERMLGEKRIKDIVLDKLFELEDLVREFESQISPEGPVAFLTAIKTILNITKIYNERRIKDISKIKDEKIRLKRLYKHARMILDQIVPEVHYTLLPFLEPKLPEVFPTEILGATRALAAKFEDPNKIEILFVPEWRYQFSIKAFYNVIQTMIDSLKDYLPDRLVNDELKKIKQGDQPDSFIFLAYPWVEYKSILLPSLVAHEVSHLKEYKENLRKKFLPASLHPSVESFVQRLANEPIDAERTSTDSENSHRQLTLGLFYSKEILRQKIVAECMEITENWVKEFIVDLLAIHLLGPAYFWSFVELASVIGFETEGGDTHPSMNWRLKVMIDELKELGYLSQNFKSPIKALLGRWHQHLSNIPLEPQNQYYHIAYLTIEQSLPKIHKGIKNVTKEFSYNYTRYEREVNRIIPFFEKGILPVQYWNESRKAFDNFDSIDIINAAWEVYKIRMSSFYKLLSMKNSDAEQRAKQNFYRFVLKAIESAEIVRQWKKE